MKTKEYYKEYRKQRADRYLEMMKSIDGKLDRILGAIAEKILEHQKIIDAEIHRDIAEAKHMASSSDGCKVCHQPATYMASDGIYCGPHTPLGSKKI